MENAQLFLHNKQLVWEIKSSIHISIYYGKNSVLSHWIIL